MLKTLRRPEAGEAARPRLAVVGVGNELGGDDAAGLRVARRLKRKLAGDGDVLVIEGGPAPENFTGALRKFGPEVVLLVDAAQMDLPPGEVRLLPWQEAAGFSGSTHTLPLEMLARYLESELGCRVFLLGIQPAGNQPGAPLSEAVKKAVKRVVWCIAE